MSNDPWLLDANLDELRPPRQPSRNMFAPSPDDPAPPPEEPPQPEMRPLRNVDLQVIDYNDTGGLLQYIADLLEPPKSLADAIRKYRR